ncbi:MAG: hypothetical protein RR767_03700 [Acinetobacter sp.]
MSGMLFIGFDVKKPQGEQGLSGLVNGSYWDAFGDLLDEVFLSLYPNLHSSIKSEEGEYLKFYTFEDLDSDDFNLAIKLIREHLLKMEPSMWQSRDYITDMAKWQSMARLVWEESAEPYIVLDSRYDPKLG